MVVSVIEALTVLEPTDPNLFTWSKVGVTGMGSSTGFMGFKVMSLGLVHSKSFGVE